MASKESKKTNAKDVPATPSLTSLPNIPNLPSLSNIPQTAPSQMPSQLPPTQMPPQAPPELSEKAKEKIEKIKSQLEKFKKTILKKYPYTLAIGILPPLPKTPLPKSPNPIQNPELAQAIKREEQEKNKTHLILIVPDEKLKEINKYEKFCAESIKALKLDAKFNANTPKEVWQRSFDGHFIEIERIGMAYPIHDKGILGALRVATIHKNLILKKFEKYVVSYVIAGSLVRGQATKTSDVDVYVVIDDTDVKRMPRLELKEKLRAIINNYTFQANDLAASKNKLSCQAYILTEFWESVMPSQLFSLSFVMEYHYTTEEHSCHGSFY